MGARGVDEACPRGRGGGGCGVVLWRAFWVGGWVGADGGCGCSGGGNGAYPAAGTGMPRLPRALSWEPLPADLLL